MEAAAERGGRRSRAGRRHRADLARLGLAMARPSGGAGWTSPWRSSGRRTRRFGPGWRGGLLAAGGGAGAAGHRDRPAGSWCRGSGGRPTPAGDQVRVATAAEAVGRGRHPSRGGAAGPAGRRSRRRHFEGSSRRRSASVPDRGGAPAAWLAGGGPGAAQPFGRRGGARAAWFDHDASGLVADSPRLLVQLPGTDPSAALGPAQAAALLADFLASAQEVETMVRAAREVEPGRGYVELLRRYRVSGNPGCPDPEPAAGLPPDPGGVEPGGASGGRIACVALPPGGFLFRLRPHVHPRHYPTTPAKGAGIADRVWTVEEVCGVLASEEAAN